MRCSQPFWCLMKFHLQFRIIIVLPCFIYLFVVLSRKDLECLTPILKAVSWNGQSSGNTLKLFVKAMALKHCLWRHWQILFSCALSWPVLSSELLIFCSFLCTFDYRWISRWSLWYRPSVIYWRCTNQCRRITDLILPTAVSYSHTVVWMTITLPKRSSHSNLLLLRRNSSSTWVSKVILIYQSCFIDINNHHFSSWAWR